MAERLNPLPRLQEETEILPWADRLITEIWRRWRSLDVSVSLRKNSGAVVGTRPQINLIEGLNITLTMTDDGVSDEVDVTIAASGSGLTHPQVMSRTSLNP
jgi:hypothetical protein